MQRILKSNNIEPLNPGQKPLFYDLREFEKYYFIAKKTFRKQQVEDNSFAIEERKQLKVETLFNKIKVGNNAFVSLGAVLINDINVGERVAGNFAYNTKKFMKEFKMKKSEE